MCIVKNNSKYAKSIPKLNNIIYSHTDIEKYIIQYFTLLYELALWFFIYIVYNTQPGPQLTMEFNCKLYIFVFNLSIFCCYSVIITLYLG